MKCGRVYSGDANMWYERYSYKVEIEGSTPSTTTHFAGMRSSSINLIRQSPARQFRKFDSFQETSSFTQHFCLMVVFITLSLCCFIFIVVLKDWCCCEVPPETITLQIISKWLTCFAYICFLPWRVVVQFLFGLLVRVLFLAAQIEIAWL